MGTLTFEASFGLEPLSFKVDASLRIRHFFHLYVEIRCFSDVKVNFKEQTCRKKTWHGDYLQAFSYNVRSPWQKSLP